MPVQRVSGPGDTLRPLLLLVLAACIVLPLILQGPSCGHDFGFHMQSWMDAAQQIRHGRLLPRWAFSPAYNAGEPRFIFYPPLSWLIGSLLLLTTPGAAIPALYTWLCLALSGWSMYRLTRRYVTRNAALLGSAVYMANPYLLFTAFERTAYAELLAAAWMPLLFDAALTENPSPLAVALPIALLWITNAPAAVMGTYAFVLIILLRVGIGLYEHRRSNRTAAFQLLAPATIGLVLGLMLAGFYLIPAAWERRYVQIAMAIIPNMRIEDNFLFGHTGYGPHDQVLHTASAVAAALILITFIAIALAFLRQPRTAKAPQTSQPSVLETRATLTILATLAILIGIMLCHFTLPLWHALPELAFLQFPWRLLSVLGCVLGIAVAMALNRLPLPLAAAAALGCILALSSSFVGIRVFRQGCDANDPLSARLPLFLTHHGVGATDEYTPTDADNDQLRWDDPAWWLATNPNAPAPNTVPNPAATILDYDQPPPLDQTISGQAPMHLHLRLPQPEDLILNLRDYPAWRVTLNGDTHPAHLQRDDGLLAIALPAGDDTLDIRWHTLPDMWLGDALSLAALTALTWLGWRSRRIEA